jgi:hypothetical protein
VVTVGGDAALVVDIAAPVQGGSFDQSGHQPGVIFAETVGQTLYPASNPSGLKVITEVRFAGELESGGESGSVASFVVGVDRQRPRCELVRGRGCEHQDHRHSNRPLEAPGFSHRNRCR